MISKNNYNYLIRDDNKSVFELGVGDWHFILEDKNVLTDKHVLLHRICILAVLDSWHVRAAYIVWLRDKLWDFMQGAEAFRIEECNKNKFKMSNGYFMHGSRYAGGGMKYIEHVKKEYE